MKKSIFSGPTKEEIKAQEEYEKSKGVPMFENVKIGDLISHTPNSNTLYFPDRLYTVTRIIPPNTPLSNALVQKYYQVLPDSPHYKSFLKGSVIERFLVKRIIIGEDGFPKCVHGVIPNTANIRGNLYLTRIDGTKEFNTGRLKLRGLAEEKENE